MSTHKVCFYEELKKIILNLSPNTLLICSPGSPIDKTAYRQFPKYSDTQNICCNHAKIWTMGLYHRVVSPNDADRMANSEDPDQTAPLEAGWSGSALFAKTCLSRNSGKLWYLSRRPAGALSQKLGIIMGKNHRLSLTNRALKKNSISKLQSFEC